MKKNNISKFFISFSILSIVMVGCGKKIAKNEDNLYKVKLESLNFISQESSSNYQTIVDLSKIKPEIKMIGGYKNCQGKQDTVGQNINNSWSLSQKSEDSNLAVVPHDKKCQISIHQIIIDKKTYAIHELLNNNTFSSENISNVMFINTDTTSEGKDYIYLSASITPRDFSNVPSIKAKISKFSFRKTVEIVKPILVIPPKFSIDYIQTPVYTADTSKFSALVDGNGKIALEGNISFRAGPKDQKATDYFLFSGDLTDGEKNYEILNGHFTKKSNDIKKLENTDSFNITNIELKKYTDEKNLNVSEKLSLYVVLVNSKNNLNSYAIHNLFITRAE